MRILAADDDPVWLRMIEAMIRQWGDEPLAAKDGRDAWEILHGPDRPRLAILDWVMPGMDGLDICRKLREDTDSPYVYIILVTQRDSKEDLIRAFDAGADDYIRKPFDPDELRARLRAAGRIMDLQDALLMAQGELQRQATHDSLTDLLNRGAIEEMLERELARSKRDDSSVGVLLADVDHFKKVNDTYGHAGGDDILREVTRRMLGAVRAYDLVGRYGGEELLVILPRCDDGAAMRIAERTRQAIAGAPMRTGDREAPVTMSIGVATSRSMGSFDVDSLVAAADAALYRAKNGGRNRCELAVPNPERQTG
jgi:two-component system cell cycle response regulator